MARRLTTLPFRRPAFSRRQFLAGALAAAGGRAFSLTTGGKGVPALKFGLLSDVHVRHPESGDREVLERALAYFRDRGADAVVIAGDLTDEGIVGQAEIVARAWYSVFPGDKAPDGRHVEKVFIIGNHEHDAAKVRLKRILGAQGKGNPFYERGVAMADDFAGCWNALFHEPWAKQYEKEVRGFKFFASHWATKEEMEDVGAFIGPRLAGYGDGKPFFHVQHPHPFGTVRGSHIHGTWMGQNAFNALARHPNAISFSGHSHTSLTDERSLWQGAFTAIDTSTLRRVSASGAEENAAARKEEATGRMMPGMADTTMGRQGQFVEVYDDRIVLERREFLENESLGPDRVIPWPPVTKPFAPETLSAATPAPEFAEGDAVRVSAPFDGKTRGGKPVRLVKISVPSARKGGRVYSYDIVSEGGEGQGVTKTYLQNRFFLTPRHWPKRNTFLFPADALAKGRALLIYPKNCFGRRGRPLNISTSQHPNVSQ